jgi:branched-chain amino acid transport system permease protein
MTAQILLYGLVSGSHYALIALGFSLVQRTSNFFHFGHGLAYTVAAYVAYGILARGLGPWSAAAALGVLGAGLVGWAMNRVAFDRLRKRRASAHGCAIASFGLMIVGQNALQIVFGPEVIAPLAETATPMGCPDSQGLLLTRVQMAAVLGAPILTGALWWLVERTATGRRWRAVGDDSLAARMVGIDPRRVHGPVFFVASAIAGVGGVLAAAQNVIEPTMGFVAVFKGIIAAIAGGMGTVAGALAGGWMLGLIEGGLSATVRGEWRAMASFGVLTVFLLWRSRGLFGSRTPPGDRR